jgi:hypothetical protein
MTQRVFLNNNDGAAGGDLLSLSNDDAVQAAAGASGTFTSTAAQGQNYALTALIALKASSAPPPSAPPPISFRAMSTYLSRSTSTTSIDLVVPAAVQANDVLIASIFAGDYPGSSLPTVTAPGGWTLVRQVSHGGIALLRIYSRVATATDPGKTWSWTTNFFIGSTSSLVAYSGANGASPVDVSAAQDNPSAASSYSTPAVTTTAAGDLLLATYVGYNNEIPPTTGWSAPPGMTQRVFLNNNDGAAGGDLLSLSNDDAVQAAAGASGTFTSTAAQGQNYALTALIALKH